MDDEYQYADFDEFEKVIKSCSGTNTDPFGYLLKHNRKYFVLVNILAFFRYILEGCMPVLVKRILDWF